MLLFVSILIFSTSAFAQGEVLNTDKADALNSIGLFRGTDKGYELEKASTRAESAAMIVRLLGAEEEAFKENYDHPFIDVPDWADPYVGYMYKYGLTTGISKTSYGSSNIIDGKSYMTFVLRILGYDDSKGDFSWNEALEFSRGIGIVSSDEYSLLKTKPFNRDGMVLITFNSLDVSYKDSDSTILKTINKELPSVSENKHTLTMIVYERENGSISRYFVLRDDDNINLNEVNHMMVTDSGGIPLSEEQVYRKMIFLENEKIGLKEEYRKLLDILDERSTHKHLLKEGDIILFSSRNTGKYNYLKMYDENLFPNYYTQVPMDTGLGEFKIPLTPVKGDLYERLKQVEEDRNLFVENYIKKIEILPKEAFSLVDKDGDLQIKINRDMLPDTTKDFKFASNYGETYKITMDLVSQEGVKDRLRSRLKIDYDRWNGGFLIHYEVGEDNLIPIGHDRLNSILLFDENKEPIGYLYHLHQGEY